MCENSNASWANRSALIKWICLCLPALCVCVFTLQLRRASPGSSPVGTAAVSQLTGAVIGMMTAVMNQTSLRGVVSYCFSQIRIPHYSVSHWLPFLSFLFISGTWTAREPLFLTRFIRGNHPSVCEILHTPPQFPISVCDLLFPSALPFTHENEMWTINWTRAWSGLKTRVFFPMRR